MKKKILIPVLVLVAVGVFAAYSFAMPKKTVKLKVNGTVYVLPKQFTLNLAGGQYATLTVALLLPPGQTDGASSAASDSSTTGIGTLPEEAVIRSIITNDITDQPESALINSTGRTALEEKILSDIGKDVDTKVSAIYFTDLAVQ